MGGQHAPLKFDSLPRKKLSVPPGGTPCDHHFSRKNWWFIFCGVYSIWLFFVYINWLEPSRTSVANGSKIRYCRNELFGRSGCDIFLVEVFDEDFADIARSHTFPPQRSEAGNDVLGFWRLMHGRAAKSVLRISRSEIRSNTDGKRLSTALQLAALKVAESHQTSSNKQGYDMATLTHEKAADAVNPSSKSLK